MSVGVRHFGFGAFGWGIIAGSTHGWLSFLAFVVGAVVVWLAPRMVIYQEPASRG